MEGVPVGGAVCVDPADSRACTTAPSSPWHRRPPAPRLLGARQGSGSARSRRAKRKAEARRQRPSPASLPGLTKILARRQWSRGAPAVELHPAPAAEEQGCVDCVLLLRSCLPSFLLQPRGHNYDWQRSSDLERGAGSTSSGAPAHADGGRHPHTSQLAAAAEDARPGRDTAGEPAFLRDGRLLCALRVTGICARGCGASLGMVE
jgi:hypothetical protein